MTDQIQPPAPEYRDHFEWWCNNLENEVRHDPDWDEHIAEQAFAAGFRAAATPAPAPAPDAREAVARAICTACDEIPDHAGDCQGNAWRWQDYLGAADAAIAAATHAPAMPAGAEPVSLAAAVLLGVEYAREAPATQTGGGQ